MSSSANSAAVLLDRARQGSMSSLGRLMSLYANYLKFVVGDQIDHRLGKRVSASDVLQETFYEAHRDFSAFRGESPEEFLGWMRRILVNNLLRAVEQHVTTAKRDLRREVSLDQVRRGVEQSTWRFASLLTSNEETPSIDMQRREDVSQLAAALASLPADYSEVIRLRHLEGLPFAEVAVRMDRTSGAVRMLWLRALKRLREDFVEANDPSDQFTGETAGETPDDGAGSE